MSRLHKIIGCDNPERICDVVFVHGARKGPIRSWQARGAGPEDSFPHWLGQDLPSVGLWSLAYESRFFIFQGQRMPLVDQALSALGDLEVEGFGERPIVFVAHSVGGLVVKQLLLHARDPQQPKWTKILEHTKGVVFLSTPHFGFWIPKLLGRIFLQKSALELARDNPQLKSLNEGFRALVKDRKLRVKVYVEGRKSFYGLLYRMQVDKQSANPDINGAQPIPDDDKDHDTICKPESREDKIYKGVKHLIQACLNIIFICYGHKNVRWRDRLVSRLERCNPDHRFAVWYDEIGIEVGHDWQRSIEAALEAANVAIVLISPDFLASRYIQNNELPTLLERREALELQVLPVVVVACDWQGQDWLRRIQVYQGGRPITEDELDSLADRVAKKFLN